MKLTLLVRIQGFRKNLIPGQNHDNGKVFIDQSQYTMLQFTGHDSLAVEIRDFLDLQGTFQCRRVLATTTEDQETLLVLEELGTHILDGTVELENLAELIRDLGETVHDFLASLLLRGTVLAE